MEHVFNVAFLVASGLMGLGTLVITEKLKDLFGEVSKGVKYVLSFLSTATLTLAVKYLGVGSAWSLLGLIGDKLPDKPDIPDDPLGWGYWIFLFVISWLMASGLYDYLKPLFPKKG